MEFLAEIKGLNLISDLFIKSSIVLTLTFLLVHLFRNKSASLRHFLLAASFISLLLLPFLSSLSTGWETPLLPSWQADVNRTQISKDWDQLKRITLPYSSITPTLTEQQRPALSTEKNNPSNFLLKKYSLSKNIIGSALFIAWSVGLIILLSRILIGLCGALRLTRQGQKISGPSWRQLLDLFLKAISIKRKISLFSHKNVNTPLTWGVIKPVVILPIESKDWTHDQRSSALFHELSHIKRGDFLVKILARCSLALYWFNPLSWFAFRIMNKEQEKACDELVLKTGVKPSTYAVNLLSIKKSGQFHWSPTTAALGAVGKSQLNERLIAILKKQLKPKEVNMKTKIFLFSLIVLTIAIVGLARPTSSEAFSENSISQKDTVQSISQDVSKAISVQEKQVKEESQETEQKQAEQKETEEQKDQKITFVTEDGKKIELIISVDDKGETIISKIKGDMVIDIDKDSDENKYTLFIDGKNLVLQKDEKGNWTLKADKGEKLNYSIATSFSHDKKYNVGYTFQIDKGDKKIYTVKASPYLHVGEVVVPEKNVKLYVSPIHLALSEAIGLHIIEDDEGEKKIVRVSPHIKLHGVPVTTTYSLKDTQIDQKELEEKLAEITEKLKEIREKIKIEVSQEIQEEALKEVEEMLKMLSEKLKEKSLELKDIAISVHPKTADVWVHKDDDLYVDLDKGKSIKWVAKGDVNFDVAVDVDVFEGEKISFVTTDEGEFQITVRSHFHTDSKAKYDEIIKKLKKELPQGYTLESIFDEKAELLTINIKGAAEDEDLEKKFKEIAKKLEKQLSSIK